MLNGARVLCVGRREAVEQTVNSLRAAGATVNEAASAQVGLLLLQSLHHELLLTELLLPDADGYALVGAVRRLPDPELAAIPCVAISDAATDAERQRSLLAGFQLHVTRPVDAAALTRTLAGLRRLARLPVPAGVSGDSGVRPSPRA